MKVSAAGFVVVVGVVVVAAGACGREVQDDAAPVANAGVDVSAVAGAGVSFVGSGSSDDVSVDTFAWDFGDGSDGAGAVVDHVYVDAGGYVATLTVADSSGQTATDTVVVTVAAEVAVARIVVGGISGVGARVGDELTFDASTSTSPAALTSASWRFGDGATADGVVVRHTYVRAGAFTVRLVVADGEGNEAQSETVVTVSAADVSGTYDVVAADFACANYAAVFPDAVLVVSQDGNDVDAAGGDGRVYAGSFDDDGLALRGAATLSAGGCGNAVVDIDWRATVSAPGVLSGTATAFFDLDVGCQCTAAWNVTATRR